VLTAQGAQLRQIGPQRAGEHRPHPRCTLQQLVVLPPERGGGADGPTDAGIEISQPRLQPGEMGLNIGKGSGGQSD
jgi:hypothetical protein